MRGDIIHVEERHRRAAEKIAAVLVPLIRGKNRVYTISIAGESGSGKSETAKALQEVFQAEELRTEILQQDDYFHLPPKSNDRRRREEISWVGPGEVHLDLLDNHLRAAKEGAPRIGKPLVIFAEDRISGEDLSLEGVRVLIAEGTYTTLLKEVDTRIFIDRDLHTTLEDRRRRGREAIEPFLEEVLEIEHRLIAPGREKADIVISREFEVLL